ncbi:MAG: M48 family metallopeptidase [Burkholderiaceae bacterium]|nr:M48 family metallopeptidase [Burkholderiaceae bacterium]
MQGSTGTTGTFGGRLFAPGLDGVGVPAIGQWRQGRLVVCVQDGATDREWLAPEHPTLSAGGFNAGQLSVAWPAEGGQVQFFVDAGAARTAFAAGMPASLAQPHGAAQRAARGVERRLKLWWAALAAVALLPVLALALLVLRGGDVVDWAVRQIPHAQEAKLGDLVLAQTRAQMRVIDSGPAVDAVKHMGERLTPGTLHRYRWLVVDKPEMNAFAAPGGVVVVYSGLLKGTDTPEEAAGVIAHEVAHAELRHGLQGMVKSMGLRAGAAVLLGDWSGAVLSEVSTSLLEMKFSREAETEADAEGLHRMVAAKINPEGMARFMDKLAAQSKDATPPALLSTHPASAERATTLRALAAQHPGPWEPLPLDWAAVKASLP